MKRVLYVEDNSVTRILVRRQLAPVAEILTAASLGEARMMLRGQAFDLVLADVNLPDGNSLDLVTELRSHYSPTQLPIILVSAGMDQRLRIRALHAGANDCFPMPTPWATLIEAVRQMLNHPYVQPNDLGVVAVTWVEGTIDNRFWLYCPELNLRLEGEALDIMRQTMEQRLQGAIAAGAGLPFVSRVRVSERLVEVGAEAGTRVVS